MNSLIGNIKRLEIEIIETRIKTCLVELKIAKLEPIKREEVVKDNTLPLEIGISAGRKVDPLLRVKSTLSTELVDLMSDENTPIEDLQASYDAWFHKRGGYQISMNLAERTLTSLYDMVVAGKDPSYDMTPNVREIVECCRGAFQELYLPLDMEEIEELYTELKER